MQKYDTQFLIKNYTHFLLFSFFSIVSPKELTGFLVLNDRLNNPEILFKGKLHGPEAFASYNGELYTGVHGGYIVKIKENDEVIPIAKFGKQCGKLIAFDKNIENNLKEY